MRTTKLFIVQLLAIAMLPGMNGSYVLADEQGNSAPSYYPSDFQKKGIVRTINAGQKQLIIDGLSYHYQVDLQVHSPTQKYGTVYSLKEGQIIGFSYKEDLNGKRIITEIWVIPNTEYQGG
ncbi:hypothetical protein [Sulfuriflexus sp.]|uniref:PilY2 family type 4a fimbrial biogenesis protein n=1 Tax=Sulfuriflexus sp. TaxID=2015443 RepID=UPI0028CD8F44|nr:hypothetical protein [Sulfuriflexus sp.]MDT8403755.1 hypothetical protein [Sulfuriflexus sp.]